MVLSPVFRTASNILIDFCAIISYNVYTVTISGVIIQMIKQEWLVTIDEQKINVEYSCSPLTGRTVLSVDGDSFTVKGKPFAIGLVRREPLILGGSQAMLDVKNGGRAELICRDGEVEEIIR